MTHLALVHLSWTNLDDSPLVNATGIHYTNTNHITKIQQKFEIFPGYIYCGQEKLFDGKNRAKMSLQSNIIQLIENSNNPQWRSELFCNYRRSNFKYFCKHNWKKSETGNKLKFIHTSLLDDLISIASDRFKFRICWTPD